MLQLLGGPRTTVLESGGLKKAQERYEQMLKKVQAAL